MKPSTNRKSSTASTAGQRIKADASYFNPESTELDRAIETGKKVRARYEAKKNKKGLIARLVAMLSGEGDRSTVTVKPVPIKGSATGKQKPA